jgi:hypothetical protein
LKEVLRFQEIYIMNDWSCGFWLGTKLFKPLKWYLGTLFNTFLEWITNHALQCSSLGLLHKLFVDTLMDKCARPSAAALPLTNSEDKETHTGKKTDNTTITLISTSHQKYLVKEKSEVRKLNSLINISIVHDNKRRLAS